MQVPPLPEPFAYPGARWAEVGIHGLHRLRNWDAIASVEHAGIVGDEAWVVALPDGSAVVEEGSAGFDPAPLVDAIRLARPFRAYAVRKAADVWVVAAWALQVVEIARDLGGDELEVVWDGQERRVLLDGSPTLLWVPELDERTGGSKEPFAATLRRVSGRIWEVVISPL